MELKKNLLFMAIMLAISFPACESDEVSTEVSVYTEEIVFTSGEKAIMTGRVLAQALVAIEDHGFEVSSDTNFANPIVISLGERGVPGRFVGETSALSIHLDYVCRAFIKKSGTVTYGNVLGFETLSPKAIDFEPKEGTQNKTMTIEGRNLTADTKVLWNDMAITPDNIIAETYLEFKIPALSDSHIVQLKLVSQGDTASFSEPFEYIIGEWENIGSFGDTLLAGRHIYFENGNDFVYGLGYTSVGVGLSLTSRINVVDKNTLDFSTINFNGTPTEGAFFTEGFFGGGSVAYVRISDTSLPITSEFWKYDNQGFTQLANVPAYLYQAVALKSGNKIYLYGGEDSNRDRNTEIFVYNISSGQWSTAGSSPISPLNSLFHFTENGSNYFVAENGELHRHDLNSDSWEVVNNFPIEPKLYGTSQLINGQALLGLQDVDRRFFQYTPAENKWRSKKPLPDNNPYNTDGAWIHNDRVFVIRADAGNGKTKIIWALDPNAY